MPAWLAKPIAAALHDLAPYPDDTEARAAVAHRHGRDAGEVVLTAGAAQAFVLLAQALRPQRAVVVQPQFTEPEAALRAAGHDVDHVLLSGDFTLDPIGVPDDADLVVLGNPTNPTSVVHPAEVVASLARPGRVLVVDEAFADTIPGEPTSLASRRDVPGLVVVRSLTKTWGLAGLRVGYLLAPADLADRLESVQPLWPVSTPALAAITACMTPVAVAAADEIARALAADRARLAAGLEALPGVTVIPPSSSFVLVHLAGADRVRERLRAAGFAVRRGDTFPGLGPDWLRIAVRDADTTEAFLAAFAAVLRS